MKKNIGIWIDTKQAFIIKLLNNKHSIKKIDSNIETRERILGESKKYGRFGNQYLTYEKNTENKRKNQTTIFFKILLKEIVNYNSIVLFGPSNMKNLFEKEIRESAARIEVKDMPLVNANKTQMFQLFQNLLGNALKYRDKEMPRIVVSSKELPDHYIFSIEDNGIGIDKAYHEKIFQIFQRLHSKGSYSGTGIGLAICKKIVERHGGSIWVEGEKEKGSRFYFTLAK